MAGRGASHATTWLGWVHTAARALESFMGEVTLLLQSAHDRAFDSALDGGFDDGIK